MHHPEAMFRHIASQRHRTQPCSVVRFPGRRGTIGGDVCRSHLAGDTDEQDEIPDDQGSDGEPDRDH